MKTIFRTYQFELQPNQEQKTLLDKHFGCIRYVFNHFLNLRIQKYKDNKESFGYNSCSAELTKMKRREEYSWLKLSDATSLQQSLKDLDRAYSNFFNGIKNGKDIGFPKFKSKRKAKLSYRCVDGINIIDDNNDSVPIVFKI